MFGFCCAQDLADFDVLTKGASSRIETIEKLCAMLVKLLKQVKICPGQCKNLVNACLKGSQQMKGTYFAVSENDMWQLYYAEKLPHLVSSLDRLLSTLGSTEDLVQTCGCQWGKMGLVVSIPLPPPGIKRFSRFDLLINELKWNLDSIRYVLNLTDNLEFKWDENRCGYVIERNQMNRVAAAEAMESEECERFVTEDRAHFLSKIEDGSLLTPENFILHWAWQKFSFKFAADRMRDHFATILKERLKESPVLSNESSSLPKSFWIDRQHLKTRNKLSGESNTRAIFTGEWCGQEVAIRIVKNATEEAVEREAVLMLKVQHPNIVGFLGCAFTDYAPPQLAYGRRDEKCTAGYLVMELMQEDLRCLITRCNRIRPGGPFPLTVVVDILLQIVGAMIHMHNCNIIHRDLKAANCVVSSKSSPKSSPLELNSYVVKLIDFETSKMLNPDAEISDHTVDKGTRRWMAPEVWGRASGILAPYTRSADVYSFGMTCYEVITGLLPFHKCVLNSDLKLELDKGKRPVLPTSVTCPEGLKELMSKCWAEKPSNRPEFKEVQKDLWTIKYELELH